LVAQRLGVRVPYVTLYPMGGVATMVDMPRKPGHEFLISIVGPLFNFVLMALLYLPLLYVLGHEQLFAPSLDTWEGVAASAYWANPVLGAFNLIPAFPMDGGRMLRAVLSKGMKRLTATRVAVFLGQGFAILFFLQGIRERHWMLSMVGAYVFISASQELKAVKHEPAA
jgi:Zn-dependent protease